MVAGFWISFIGLASIVLAEDGAVLDNGESGGGSSAMNTVSADYSEISVIEEIPVDLNGADKPDIQVKVKVHNSGHRKHKKLPMVLQAAENHKIEDLPKDDGAVKKKPKDGLGLGNNSQQAITSASILANIQENPSYDWLEAGVVPKQ